MHIPRQICRKGETLWVEALIVGDRGLGNRVLVLVAGVLFTIGVPVSGCLLPTRIPPRNLAVVHVTFTYIVF